MKRFFPIIVTLMLILTLAVAGCGGGDSGGGNPGGGNPGGGNPGGGTPSGPATVYAFDRAWGSNGHDDGQFNLPCGVAIDAANNIYVTDSGNDRIQVFDASGNFKIKLYDSTLFPSLWGIAVDANGNIYVAGDTNNCLIRKCTIDSYLDNLSTGTNNNVRGVAVDKGGNVYVTTTGFLTIAKFRPNQTTPEWQKNVDFAAFGIAVDANNNLYVTDYTHNCIRKYNAATGEFVTQWGSAGNNPGQFSDPYGVAVDGDGYIYVVEFNNNRVQKFKPDGTFLCQWGSYGSGNGQFSLPSAIAVDTAGNVYVVDSGNNRIQKFKPVR
jgi:streptogramin lyase